MSDREAFEKLYPVPNATEFNKQYNEYRYIDFKSVNAPNNDKWEAFCDGWKAAQAQAQASKPIAAVHGWFHGECVIRALDPEAVLPAGMALYSQPQSIPDCHGIANGKRTEDMSNKELRYHMQELSAMCYRQADELEALKAQAVNQQLLEAKEAGFWGRAAARQSQRIEELLDLIDTFFTQYEDGAACYESPEDAAGYLGRAVHLDDKTFNRITQILNEARPRAAIAAAQEQSK